MRARRLDRTTAMNESLQTIDHIRNTAIDLAMRFGPKLLAAILILALGVMVARWVGRWLERGLAHIELEPPVRLLLLRIGRVLVMLLFIVMALQNEERRVGKECSSRWSPE